MKHITSKIINPTTHDIFHNPKMKQKLGVILLLVFILFIVALAPFKDAKANPIINASTPGIVMAKMVFEIGNSDKDPILTPKQMRLQIMNSGGSELIYVKTSLENFEPLAGFSHGYKDSYKRPPDYPQSRENFIQESPKTYKEALARYERAISLYKSSKSISARKHAKEYMESCYQKAASLYTKELRIKAQVQ